MLNNPKPYAVQIVIDGEEVTLDFRRTIRNGDYAEFGEPEPYSKMGLGASPLIVTAYIKPGWTPSKGVGK